MKIRPDQIDGLGQQQQAKKTKRPQQGFGDLLGQEVAKAAGTAPIAPPDVSSLAAASAVTAVRSVGETEQSVVGQVESVLGKLDDYSAMLSGGTSLKEADTALDAIAEDVGRIKARPDMAGDTSGLRSLVDELETLAVTERIKFDRGDYL